MQVKMELLTGVAFKGNLEKVSLDTKPDLDCNLSSWPTERSKINS